MLFSGFRIGVSEASSQFQKHVERLGFRHNPTADKPEYRQPTNHNTDSRQARIPRADRTEYRQPTNQNTDRRQARIPIADKPECRQPTSQNTES
ncbi:hypothetical protein JTE90_023313 [Oedothorax gibbosus]|uniref:Uncharacterized protein n=1 Tax=Oedothorax gibbosus TaxID=931172 RepID=A0AAV6TGG7_9ARAC|nr:hypothetical protein JTE90_023313 [Oedothorax gibbosus]